MSAPVSTDARLILEVLDELERARTLFGPMRSPHEGYATILEEADELWEKVKANVGRGPEARAEAIQVAAMAIRYVHDLCDEPSYVQMEKS